MELGSPSDIALRGLRYEALRGAVDQVDLSARSGSTCLGEKKSTEAGSGWKWCGREAKKPKGSVKIPFLSSRGRLFSVLRSTRMILPTNKPQSTSPPELRLFWLTIFRLSCRPRSKLISTNYEAMPS